MPVGLIFFTLIVIVFLTFLSAFDVAVILTVPFLIPFTTPLLVTVATFLSEDFHLTLLLAFDGLTNLTLTVTLPPMSTVLAVAEIVSDFGFTVAASAVSEVAAKVVKTKANASAMENILQLFFALKFIPSLLSFNITTSSLLIISKYSKFSIL